MKKNQNENVTVGAVFLNENKNKEDEKLYQVLSEA
jgi:hypothetical protein